MATLLRQITDRVDTVVQASAPAGCTIWRDRADAISREEAPGINQRWRDVGSDAFSDDIDQHLLEFELRIHTRAEPITPAAEDLHEPVHRAVMADATLRGLVDSIRIVEQTGELAEADETAGLKVARYRVKYQTLKTAL